MLHTSPGVTRSLVHCVTRNHVTGDSLSSTRTCSDIIPCCFSICPWTNFGIWSETQVPRHGSKLPAQGQPDRIKRADRAEIVEWRCKPTPFRLRKHKDRAMLAILWTKALLCDRRSADELSTWWGAGKAKLYIIPQAELHCWKTIFRGSLTILWLWHIKPWISSKQIIWLNYDYKTHRGHTTCQCD